MSTPTPIPSVPPPWKTKCTAYAFAYYTSPSTNTSSTSSNTSNTSTLPRNLVYSPLEASHAPFSSTAECGEFRGGLGMLQVLRYTETPVGPYDELAVLPGHFDVPVGEREKGGKLRRHSRITGIWVSQKLTCWNGRKNWNIPKHLARFKFTPPDTSPSPSCPLKIEVFPEDPSATKPFFTATVQPMQWLPSFRFSSGWASYLGQDTRIVQPPLPKGETPELCGTDEWKMSNPVLYGRNTRLVWIDMKQPTSGSEAEGDGDEEGDSLLGKSQKNENWWPGMKRWQVGLWFDNAALDLGEPEILG